MARNKSMNLGFDPYEEIYFIIRDSNGVGGSLVMLDSIYYEIVNNEWRFFLNAIFTDYPEIGLISFNHLGFPPSQTVFLDDTDTNCAVVHDLVYFYDKSTIALFSDAVGSSVDLTPVMNALSLIQSRVDTIPDFESVGSIVSSSLASLDAVELNNLHEDIVTLGTQLQMVTVPLQSLNGNGSEYKDGVQVLVTGRLPVYTVSRSYMSMMDTDTYTCVYDLEALDGSKTTCPESFLTPYVAPVVTTP